MAGRSSMSSRCRNAFDEKRERSFLRTGTIHMSASTGLDVFPLVRRFAEVMEREEMVRT